MSNRSQSPFTKTLTGDVLTFTNEMGYSKISVKWLSGTVTVTGQGSAGTTASGAISLNSANSEMTAVCDAAQINNYAIDASAGSCVILATS